LRQALDLEVPADADNRQLRGASAANQENRDQRQKTGPHVA